MDYPIIEEKLKVFVSSAIAPENASNLQESFNWTSFRKKVKESLNKCKYIQAFTIEDRASTMKSNDFMVANVDSSDIVVLLIKNEFRTGTVVEYTRCRSTSKPLLVFFFGDETENDEVTKLRKELDKSDYCTYRNLSNFENAETIIANDVIQDVIFYYHHNHHPVSESQHIDIEGISIRSAFDNDSYIPTKSILSQFKSSYDTIYKYIGMSNFPNKNDKDDKSSLHIIGEQIINWVINGEEFLTLEVKKSLIKTVAEIYTNTGWYSKRLDAIDCFINNNMVGAYLSEKEALNLAEEAKISDWIITDILIDLRNLQYLCPKDQINFESEDFQKRLDDLKSIVHVPVLDRYLENTYETLLREEIKRSTASFGTTFYGSSFNEIIAGVENYLFTSILYGSYTHLTLTRKVFATIFYRTGKLYNSAELLYSSVKMYLFDGQYKEFIRLSNLEWNTISNITILNADELWHQANNMQEKSKNIICIGAIHRVGLYMNEHSFRDAESFLFRLSESLPWNISNDYIDCLFNISCRMDQKKLVQILIKIIEHNNYINANHLTELICSINFEEVEDEYLYNLCDVLKKNIPKMIERNGNPQFLAVLFNAKPEIFSVLETLPDNGLSGLQKQLYDLNTNKGNWNAVLVTEIQSAKKQFEANRQKGVYHGFGTNPYSLISKAFDHNPSSEIISTITELFFPLCIEILSNECNLETKDQCAECLCIVISYYKKNKLTIPCELIDCIGKSTLENASVFPIATRSLEGLQCRLLSLKIILGINGKDELIQWCFSYSKKDASERHALVKCVQAYLQFSDDVNTTVDSLIVSIVFQCCDDRDVFIRSIACECLWYILNSSYSKQAEERIKQMVTDPAPAIRSCILSICEENNTKHKDLINWIALCLINDANYRIRVQAKRLLETNLNT